MPQTSGPISQGTATERQFTDTMWRDLFGDEPGVLSDMDGTAYAVTLPSDSDVASIGSMTQASTAKVAGFVHRIPASSPDTLTIPAASGATRTDIISLRYDPNYSGLPGPVRLYRIVGTSSEIPSYDASPPGVEDLPLWAVTRIPGQSLSQATLQRLFPRIVPTLELPSTAALPASSPVAATIYQDRITWRRSASGWDRRGGPAVVLYENPSAGGSGVVNVGAGQVGVLSVNVPASGFVSDDGSVVVTLGLRSTGGGSIGTARVSVSGVTAASVGFNVTSGNPVPLSIVIPRLTLPAVTFSVGVTLDVLAGVAAQMDHSSMRITA